MSGSCEELRALELARIDVVIARLLARIDREQPDDKAVELYVRVVDCKAKLAGLYAPRKELRVEAHTTPVGAPTTAGVSNDVNVMATEVITAACSWMEVSEELVDRAVAHYAFVAAGPFGVPREQGELDACDDANDEYDNDEAEHDASSARSHRLTSNVATATPGGDACDPPAETPRTTPVRPRVLRLID
jgi:hypothetical protein